MAYDTSSDTILLFGGRSVNGTYLNDVWSFDTSTNIWMEITATGPVARYAHSMVFDPVSNMTIMVGGGTDAGDTTFNDTWQLQNDSWTEGDAIPLSGGASYHTLIYRDDEQSLLLVTGGSTWEYK
jgi:N-acetylneuraminic acid mutarotase